MPEYITISKQVERRTYIRGKFVGKYVGYIDYNKSNLYYENFYNIELLEGEIILQKNKKDIYRWTDVNPKEVSNTTYSFDALPQPIKCKVYDTDENVKNYKIILQEPQVINCVLSKVLNETDKVFGDIEGDISGYIVHFDTEKETVKVPDQIDTPIPQPIHLEYKTNNKTGNIEISGNYQRWEYYYSDGTTYWGEWTKKGKTEDSISFLEVLGNLIQIIILLAIVIPILIVGWPVILPIIGIVLGLYFLSSLTSLLVRLLGWLIQLIGIAFLIFFIFSLVSIFSDTPNDNDNSVADVEHLDLKEEVKEVEYDPTLQDSIISHHRIWNDYDGNKYTANISTRVSDFREVNRFRNNLSGNLQSTNQYNNIISQLYNLEKNKLNLIYPVFDSLKTEYNLNKMQFAEMIVSCIQDIPYTLILNEACNASLYDDKFITEYLKKGEKCEGFIKYGLFAPTEFMANLSGDCDTRTLLLFTILDHYQYDVVMLGSELYKHSIIGINLPYKGISKIIKNKKYILWETTARGIRPGVISRDISDTQFWDVTIISKNN